MENKIGLFWGSNTGNQEIAAVFLREYMESEGLEFDEYNIADTDPEKMLEYKKEFKNMNDKLNEYVIQKVNDIVPNDYNITTTFLPRKGEPIGISELDNNIDISYLE